MATDVNRPKRNIQKPKRYKRTSDDDDGLNKTKKSTIINTEIEDIRAELRSYESKTPTSSLQDTMNNHNKLECEQKLPVKSEQKLPTKCEQTLPIECEQKFPAKCDRKLPDIYVQQSHNMQTQNLSQNIMHSQDEFTPLHSTSYARNSYTQYMTSEINQFVNKVPATQYSSQQNDKSFTKLLQASEYAVPNFSVSREQNDNQRYLTGIHNTYPSVNYEPQTHYTLQPTIVQPQINYTPQLTVQPLNSPTVTASNNEPYLNIASTSEIEKTISTTLHSATTPCSTETNTTTQVDNTKPKIISDIILKKKPLMEKQSTALQSSKMDNLLEHIKEYYDPKLQRIYERLVTIEKLLKKKVINKGNIPNKPNMLPLHTIEEFERFEELPPKELDDIVDYFIHIGGFNLRETITFIINEAMTPEVTTHFTWWGNKNKRQLFDTKLMYTIFRAVRANRNFESPDRKMFQECVMNALRATKQKHRRAMNVNDNEVTMTRHRMEQIANIVYTKPCNNNLQKTRTSSGPKSKDSIVKQKHRCETDVKDDEAKKQCRRKQIANVSFAKLNNNNVEQSGTSSGQKSKENDTDIFSEDSISSKGDYLGMSSENDSEL